MYDRIVLFLTNMGYLGIAAAGLAEAIFMPFPMEFVYIPIAIAMPSRALIYTSLLILVSLIGSVIAYWLGRLGGKELICKLGFVKKHYNEMQNLYNKNSFLVIMTSSFTPIPYEVYTLTAGLFGVNFKKYILASVLSRIIRYVPQGILIYMYGEAVLSFMKKFGLLSAVVLSSIAIFLSRIYLVYKKEH